MGNNFGIGIFEKKRYYEFGVLRVRAMSKEFMLEALNGMYWDRNVIDFNHSLKTDTDTAIESFQKELASITWHWLSVLEDNPSTITQVSSILDETSAQETHDYNLMQVKNYGDGAKELVRQLEMGDFSNSLESACALHQFVGKKDALEWGVLRNMTVAIDGVEYSPPQAEKLHAIASKGFTYLETEIEDPRERAIGLFLFMSRNKFFFDANKRTASLMMNGCLMQHGYWPITILNRDSEVFHERLGLFYETGDATSMMEFFEQSVLKLYQTP